MPTAPPGDGDRAANGGPREPSTLETARSQLRDAAFVVALTRIAEAHEARGLWP